MRCHASFLLHRLIWSSEVRTRAIAFRVSLACIGNANARWPARGRPGGEYCTPTCVQYASCCLFWLWPAGALLDASYLSHHATIRYNGSSVDTSGSGPLCSMHAPPVPTSHASTTNGRLRPAATSAYKLNQRTTGYTHTSSACSRRASFFRSQLFRSQEEWYCWIHPWFYQAT